MNIHLFNAFLRTTVFPLPFLVISWAEVFSYRRLWPHLVPSFASPRGEGREIELGTMVVGIRGMKRGGSWSSEMTPTVARMLLVLFWSALRVMKATAAAEGNADSPRWEVGHEFVSMCAHAVLSFGSAHFGVHPSIQHTLSQVGSRNGRGCGEGTCCLSRCSKK